MPQADLKDRICWLWERVWKLHFKAPANQAAMPVEQAQQAHPQYLPVVKIYLNKGHNAVWYTSQLHAEGTLRATLRGGAGSEGSDRKGDYFVLLWAWQRRCCIS